jgi:hypothetical protein
MHYTATYIPFFQSQRIVKTKFTRNSKSYQLGLFKYEKKVCEGRRDENRMYSIFEHTLSLISFIEIGGRGAIDFYSV